MSTTAPNRHARATVQALAFLSTPALVAVWATFHGMNPWPLAIPAVVTALAVTLGVISGVRTYWVGPRRTGVFPAAPAAFPLSGLIFLVGVGAVTPLPRVVEGGRQVADWTSSVLAAESTVVMAVLGGMLSCAPLAFGAFLLASDLCQVVAEAAARRAARRRVRQGAVCLSAAYENGRG